MRRDFWVYIMASHTRRMYVGVTANLYVRVAQHRAGLSTFTSRYRMTRLVYYETTANAYAAIAREKQIKAGSRKAKEKLINSMNAEWRELFDEVQGYN